MSQSTTIIKKTVSFPLLSVIFLIFLTFKLAEIGQVATWSWWWVTSPIWIPLAAALSIYLLAGLLMLAAWLLDRISNRNRWKKFI